MCVYRILTKIINSSYLILIRISLSSSSIIVDRVIVPSSLSSSLHPHHRILSLSSLYPYLILIVSHSSSSNLVIIVIILYPHHRINVLIIVILISSYHHTHTAHIQVNCSYFHQWMSILQIILHQNTNGLEACLM